MIDLWGDQFDYKMHIKVLTQINQRDHSFI